MSVAEAADMLARAKDAYHRVLTSVDNRLRAAVRQNPDVSAEAEAVRVRFWVPDDGQTAGSTVYAAATQPAAPAGASPFASASDAPTGLPNAPESASTAHPGEAKAAKAPKKRFGA